MLAMAWVIFLFFGVFCAWTTIQYILGKSFNWLVSLMWFFSAVVTAISVGIIWGGLFSNV